MGLLEIINKDLIIVPLTSSTKDGVIHDLIEKYAINKGLAKESEEKIFDEIMAREALGSTAMENGIAIPHCKIHDLEAPAVVIGVSRLPVDFGGETKSKVFFLVLASQNNPTEHVQLLASIARICSSDAFVRLLSSAKTPADIYQLFFD